MMQTKWSTWWKILLLSVSLIGCQADQRMPPFIVDYPSSNIIYLTGQSRTLPCTATGIPTPTYSWTKDGVELEMNDRIFYDPSKGDGTIIFETPMKALGDNGQYQCIAVNQHGSALSQVVNFTQADFTYDTPNDAIIETRDKGESLKLVLHTSVESYPSVAFSWKIIEPDAQFGGTTIQTSRRVALDQSTGTLYMANVLLTDVPEGSQIYKLDARNANLDTTQGGSPYGLVVNDVADPANRAPNRMLPEVETYQQVVLKGMNTTLKCFFEGLPTPEVGWRQPPTGPSPNRIDCTKESSTECFITRLEYSDAGTYTCTGTNTQGSQSSNIELIVESVPTFTTAPSSANVTTGNSRSFICQPDAVPAATITWYSNGEEITRDNPGSSRILFSEDMTNLTVLEVCKDCEDGTSTSDLQVFQCKVSNIHGDIYGSAYLNVLEPVVIYDKGEDQNVEIDPDLGEKFETNFTCRATTDELVLDELEVRWRFDERTLVSDSIYTIQNNGENIYINLTGIPEEDVPDYLGGYTCVATAGASAATAAYTFNIKGIEPVPLTVADFWWLFLLIFLLLLILLLCIFCVLYMQRNKGDDYPVDYYERDNGNDPEEECKDAGFHDYTRPIDYGNFKGSRGSLNSSQEPLDDGNVSTIYGYDNDGIKLSEEGSFVGQYNTYNRPTISVPSHAVSNA